jgi:hypothetical protein
MLLWRRVDYCNPPLVAPMYQEESMIYKNKNIPWQECDYFNFLMRCESSLWYHISMCIEGYMHLGWNRIWTTSQRPNSKRQNTYTLSLIVLIIFKVWLYWVYLVFICMYLFGFYKLNKIENHISILMFKRFKLTWPTNFSFEIWKNMCQKTVEKYNVFFHSPYMGRTV